MKVVLFCGGLGMRMREHSDTIPKPMVPIGYRPVLWHLMRYYAHYGHKDFILCLGYQADVIKQYFLNYEETLSNDFVLQDGGKSVTLLGSDVHDWKITFVDTGLDANIGTRLKRVQSHLEGEEAFLANYADVVTDAPLPALIEQFERQQAVALVMCVKPNYTFHFIESNEDGLGHPHPGRPDVERLDQRGLLRAAARDLRPHGRGGGAGGRAVPAPDQAAGAGHLPPRGLLGPHGLAQGEAGPRRAVPVGQPPVVRLGPQPPR